MTRGRYSRRHDNLAANGSGRSQETGRRRLSSPMAEDTSRGQHALKYAKYSTQEPHDEELPFT